MNFNKKVSGSWTDVPHYIASTDTETITTLPTTIYPLGQSATLGLKGNTVQNGTPTPDNPVPVVGVGDLDNGQYKIPISSGDVTTPVYLGEVESTRRIKKLVLTGDEDWILSYGSFRINVPDYYRQSGWIPICTHYQGIDNVTGGGDLANGQVAFLVSASANYYVYICDTNYTSAADFKSYLAAQYANGTPVTIWYVLATPTTGIVNEPLMKIGDYADTVSGITIPTTAGTNAIDVDTTLKPSEVTVNYKGWHPVADVHERDNGAWT